MKRHAQRLAPFVFKEAFRLELAPPSCPAARSTFVDNVLLYGEYQLNRSLVRSERLSV